jgi:hypothetical protein
LKVCGVGVVMLPGQELSASLVDRLHGERGNHPRSPLPDRPGPGWGRCVADCGSRCGAEAS